MPRADEPRTMVRWSAADFAVVSAAAESAGVAVGSLVRACAVRYAAEVAREASEGRLTLRRSGSASSVEEPKSERVPVEWPAVDRGEVRANAFRAATRRW